MDSIVTDLLHDGHGPSSPPLRSLSPVSNVVIILFQGPVVGALYDRYGPRWLLVGGTLMHVFGIMMASLSTEYYQLLLAQGVCSGIGAAAIFQPGRLCHHLLPLESS